MNTRKIILSTVVIAAFSMSTISFSMQVKEEDSYETEFEKVEPSLREAVIKEMQKEKEEKREKEIKRRAMDKFYFNKTDKEREEFRKKHPIISSPYFAIGFPVACFMLYFWSLFRLK